MYENENENEHELDNGRENGKVCDSIVCAAMSSDIELLTKEVPLKVPDTNLVLPPPTHISKGLEKKETVEVCPTNSLLLLY